MRRAIKAALIEVALHLAGLMILLWVMGSAHADRGKPRISPPEESMRWIQHCAIAMLTVDGLPVYRHAWCRYDPDTGLFEPLEKDLDRQGIITITPEDD